VLVLGLVLLVAVGAFAQAPDYFAFEIGSGGSYGVDSGDVTAATEFGFYYVFNENFSGGYSFRSIGVSGATPIDVTVINMTLRPVESLGVSLYSGSIDSDLGFGLGVGYDIFSNKNGLFSALVLSLDWFASNDPSGAKPYRIENGGVFTMGLKSRIGL
jgi:hypothetical protein